MSRRAGLTCMAAVLVLFVTGCGEQSAETASATPAAGSSSSPSTGGEGKKLTVAVIPKGLTHVFWQSVKAGAEKAGGEMNVTVEWQGAQKETDTAAQIGIVENAINRKVDGIVLAPLDKAALAGVIKKAHSTDIPLTVIDSAADVAESEYVSFVATDNKKGGEMAAERLGKLLDGKGKVAFIPVQPNSASTMEREAGFEETMKSRFPAITVIRTNYGMNDRANSLKVTEDVLTANPDIVGIFGPNEPAIIGALQAVKNRNLVGKVKLVGFDSTKQLEDSLEKGDIDSLIVQNPFKMGYEGVRTIVDLKAGKTPEKRLDTGVSLMTKENMNTPEMTALRSKG
ncbi:MAG: substrate-binding domain-containing protein [Capsulimonadales bacterium]|nr:substrate-binding domain-containing protein [Capsulimonadales bacterium]